MTYPKLLTVEDVEGLADQYEERVAIVAEGNGWPQEHSEQVVAESYGYLSKEALYYDLHCQRERIEAESNLKELGRSIPNEC